MNLKLTKFEDSGNLEKERLVILAVGDVQVGFFCIYKTIKSGETTVSSRITSTYWFPDRDVKKGDLVVVYTKNGINTATKNSDGTTTHFFYWGMQQAQWPGQNDAAVLAELETWQYIAK
jgi:hypothetical protein